jgi:membrane associated rhomboid family serine protease
MFPIKDENPTFSTPVITIALIAINVVMFFTEPVFQSGANAEVVQAQYFVCNASIPYEITHGKRLSDSFPTDGQAEFGSDDMLVELEAQSCPQKNVWLSILKSMFLHGGFLHIIGNMLFLWVFGNNVEDRLGKVKYLFFYLLSGIAATYAQSYVFPDSPTPLIGASGAVAGVLGAYLLMFPRVRIRYLVILIVFLTTIELPAIVGIGLWFVLQLFSSVGSVTGGADTGVAYMAHVGGFVAGMLLLAILRPRPIPQRAPIATPFD